MDQKVNKIVKMSGMIVDAFRSPKSRRTLSILDRRSMDNLFKIMATSIKNLI